MCTREDPTEHILLPLQREVRELYYQVAKATLTASRFDFDTCYEIWIDHHEHYGRNGVKRWEEHIMMQQKPVSFTTWFLFGKYIPWVLREEHLYNKLTWIECQLNKAIYLYTRLEGGITESGNRLKIWIENLRGGKTLW